MTTVNESSKYKSAAGRSNGNKNQPSNLYNIDEAGNFLTNNGQILGIIYEDVGLTTLAAVQSSPAKQAKVTDKKGVMQKALKLQMPFIANQGQVKDQGVKFYAKTFSGAVYVTRKGEMIYSFPPSSKPRSEVGGRKSEVDVEGQAPFIRVKSRFRRTIRRITPSSYPQ